MRRAVIQGAVVLLAVAGSIVVMPSMTTAASANTVIIGNVVRARASYATLGNHIDRQSLSSVKTVDAAQIELMWWPSNLEDENTVSALRAGDSTPLVLLARARSDAKGQYTIGVTPTGEMVKAATENDGWINFLLATVSGSDYVLDGFSRHWDGKKWTSFGDQRPGMSPGDAHQTIFAKDITTGEAKYGTNSKLAQRAFNTEAAGTNSITYCSFVHQYYSYKATVVMEVHNSRDSDVRYEYGGTADSDIDIGINYSGSSWTTAGTTHIGTSSGSAAGGTRTVHFGQYAASNFRYQHGYLNHGGVGYCDYAGDPFIRANRWEGGTLSYVWDVSEYDCLDAPQASYRETLVQGDDWTKNESRAHRFSIAVSFTGVNLGATSGYSSRVDMTWNAVRNWIYLCGNNAYPRYAKIVYTY